MALYIIRRSMRLLYGCIEVVASLCIIVMAIPTAVLTLPAKFLLVPFENALAASAIIAASVYVLVRGLDNVGEGLKAYPRLENIWDFVFPKSLKQNGGLNE